MKIDYTFHSHTYRCGHAVGDIEDYVSLAIQQGFKIYGVSDHVLLPGVVQPNTRGDFSLLDDYVNTYSSVKEKHNDKIQLYLGFECEFADIFVDYYKYLLKEKGFDYLICGQHNGFNNDKSPYSYLSDIEGLYRYRDDLIKAMESGLFLYIAHPDMFFLSAEEITPIYKKITKNIIAAAIKYKVVLEINIHGLLRKHNRKGKTFIDYPCEYFWQEVSKTNIPIVLGGDFHNPNEIYFSDTKEKLLNLINKYHLKIVNIEEVYKDYQRRIEKYRK